jgi:hypothetical protein
MCTKAADAVVVKLERLAKTLARANVTAFNYL